MDNEIHVCVSDSNDIVLEQSSSCQEICGLKIGEICLDGCQRHLKYKKEETGTILLKNRMIHNISFDVMRFYQNGNRVVILTPGVVEVPEIDNLTQLTHKEKEVAQLIVKGYSNQEILVELNILKSTLKTHINRIYQKLDSSFQKYRELIKN